MTKSFGPFLDSHVNVVMVLHTVVCMLCASQLQQTLKRFKGLTFDFTPASLKLCPAGEPGGEHEQCIKRNGMRQPSITDGNTSLFLKSNCSLAVAYSFVSPLSGTFNTDCKQRSLLAILIRSPLCNRRYFTLFFLTTQVCRVSCQLLHNWASKLEGCGDDHSRADLLIRNHTSYSKSHRKYIHEGLKEAGSCLAGWNHWLTDDTQWLNLPKTSPLTPQYSPK